MRALSAGTATDKGVEGADWYLKYYGKLPEYYIDADRAKELGWENAKGNLSQVASGKMIFGGEYINRKNKLPVKNGRIWYEVDVNYESGFRNSERIVFSNDGLIFATYDHYKTFVEIK